jgi:predicted nucleotidyltransferase
MNVTDFVEKNKIFEALVGSHAIGMNTETSDRDFMGVTIAPPQVYLGVLNNFEQFEQHKPDRVIYDIKKFIKLAMDGNPTILGLLFSPEDCIISRSKWFEVFINMRDEFLSTKCKFTYSGYAFSQLKRVRSHRKWLLNPITKEPTREEFGLPSHIKIPGEIVGALESAVIAEQGINRDAFNKASDEEIEVMLGKTEKSGLFTAEIMDIYRKERQYANAKRARSQYVNWEQTRNKDRAALEAKIGYDSKHAAHIARLLIQGEEILSKHTLTVRLIPEHREFCMAIRQCQVSYEELMDWATKKMATLDLMYTTSTLRKSVDSIKINKVLVDIITKFHRQNY